MMTEQEIQAIRDQQAKDAAKRFREIYPESPGDVRPTSDKPKTKRKKS